MPEPKRRGRPRLPPEARKPRKGGAHLPPTPAELEEVESLIRAIQEGGRHPITGRPLTLREVAGLAGIPVSRLGERKVVRISPENLEKLRHLRAFQEEGILESASEARREALVPFPDR